MKPYNSKLRRSTGFSINFWAAWSGYSAIRTRNIFLAHRDSWRVDLAARCGINTESLLRYESEHSYFAQRYIMEEYTDVRRAWVAFETQRGRAEWKKAFVKTDKRKAWEAAWRRKTDPEALERRIIKNLRGRIRKRLRKLLKARNHVTTARREEAAKIRQHIERQFNRGMSWENWGHRADDRGRAWHLDHIVPIAKFDLTKPEEIARANHWTNLRPLWADKNQSKGARCVNPQPELLTCVY